MSDDEKPVGVTFAVADVDTAAVLVADVDVELDPEERERLRNKIDWYLMPLMCSEYWVTTIWEYD